MTAIQPSRVGFMNRLANATYQSIVNRKYDVQLPENTKAPKSYKHASNLETQWFEAEQKEKDGMLRFNTWFRLPQNKVTQLMRQRALRAHYIYNVKRNGTAKARVVVNGKRQHEATFFSDTTSPVASQLQLRLLLLISAFRKYTMSQMDLTNAYLHADIKDTVFIVIPQGFPGEGEIARLDKATYGTKQGARRFYDHTRKTLIKIGMTQCPNEPCLFRLVYETHECFLLLYVDDALITGQPKAVQYLQTKLSEHFDSKFETPKDFLGLDITRKKDGTIQLSMQTFTKKLVDTFHIKNDPSRTILTPGRVDRKIIRGEDIIKDETFRSKVGSLMWLCMGIRYDLVYTTKELSRVLQDPTKTALEILDQTLHYVAKTQKAYLEFNPTTMRKFTPPPTRAKPIETKDIYAVDEYIYADNMQQADEVIQQQDYVQHGQQLIITCQTDSDLAGQVETRQSTSGYLVFINGALVHYHGRTERLVLTSTAAAEYIAVSRGNTACRFIRDILRFWGNKHNTYYIYTDNQASEHIVSQPTLNEHSRAIDIRHHAVCQAYLEGDVKVGGVVTTGNHSDILTKFLAPPLQEAHTTFLNLHKETQDAWQQQQQHKNSSSLDEEDTNISNNVLSYHPFDQQRSTATNVPQIRVTTPQYHRSTMNYSSPTRPLQMKQSQQFNQTIWNPIPRRFPTLPFSPSTKHKHTFTSPLQPSFNPEMQVHQHPVTHNPFMVTDGLACLHCQQISYPDTIHAPIVITARKRPPTHHPETNSSCTDERCSRIRPHPPTTSQHKISWFTRITQYFYKTSHDTHTQTQPAIITHLSQTFHLVFLPENNTKYPYVPLNPTASPFFPLKQPFLKSPTNPKYHPSKTRPSRTLYTPPSHTHYTRPPSVANIQTHKNKKLHIVNTNDTITVANVDTNTLQKNLMYKGERCTQIPYKHTVKILTKTNSTK